MGKRSDTRAEMLALRKVLREQGYFDKPTGRHVASWGAHVVVALVALLVVCIARAWAVRAGALVVTTFSFLCLATIGHTASHGGLSKRSVVNDVVLYFTYPFLLGLSARYWMKSHVIIHHPAPNRVGVDRDCDLRPIFALNEEHAHASSSIGRAYRRVQGLLLPILLPFNGFGIQVQAWRALLGELFADGLKPRAVLDLACLFAHVVVFVVMPCLWLGPEKALLIHAARISIIGMALFAVLAPGHYPAQAACVGPAIDGEDFAFRQAIATVNFRTGFIGRMMCNGLEFQLEHHLFPTISHLHLPAVSVHVREFCERVGLPHRTLSWPRAIWESYRVFFVAKVVEHGPFGVEAVDASEESKVTPIHEPKTESPSSWPSQERVA
ncbi:fatty acid desaturase family protein [Labilithrix luteola]|uniref:fatty acid desaturase family protein n=1 Tax=Labilithrix luteola TaxID=1391654 RepID=UPI001969BC25|nr:fatty acid desaturase [Labilithrix luteola]